MTMRGSELLTRLWWMRRHEAQEAVEAIMVEPVPTDEEGVRERLPDLPWTTVTKIAESMFETRD